MRVAVLGLGSMGARHLMNAQALNCVTIGFDPSTEHAAAVCGRTGAQCAGSRAEALGMCDVVVIASPSGSHRDDLAAAVDAGCHVLVEKPFAHKTDGLGAILDRAAAAALIVAVAQNLRHHPAVERARAILADGAVGPVLSAVAIGAGYLPDWRPGQDYRQGYAADPESGGVIFDWVHEIDMLAHLLGPFTAVGAAASVAAWLEIPVDEQAALVMRHQGGALSAVLLSYTTRPPLRRTTLLGPDGRMEIDIPGRRLSIVGPGPAEETIETFGGEHDDDYRTELADFLAAVAEKRPPRCPGREALAVLEGIVGARRLAGLPQAGNH